MDKDRLKEIKLIVFDLDGTLLNNDNQIGNETKKLVQLLKEKGVYFSFASGRLHSAMIKFVEELNISAPIISLDGAIIMDHFSNKVIFQEMISPKNVKKAINISNRNLFKLALCHADAIYHTEDNAPVEQLLDKFGAKFIEVEEYEQIIENTLEIVIMSERKELLQKYISQFWFPLSFGLNTSFYKSHKREDIYFLEIRRKGVNKGCALRRLCKYLNISLKQTAVIGDWYNDIEMFKTNALKVAVGNAVETIKNLADIVLKNSNNEDGVSEFLYEVYKAKK